ncbi:MAG: hypothetical protein GTO14_16750 [Anaerolineales bacterium]|nr:hypothetical protein [Anaerolineales bacterium]
MSTMFLSPVTHVAPMVTIRRERELPVPGAVLVGINEKVQASHVVAEAAPTPQHYFLDVARGLGIPVRRVPQYVVRQPGDRVERGDVIAGPVGLTRRTIRAPANGRIMAITRGRVLFEVRAQPFELRAGFPGRVIATDGVQMITLETTGALVQAAWGNGRQDFGVMRLVGEDVDSRLQTGQLDLNLRGAVLVAGICDHPAPLQQATELAVRGVILGSILSELIPVAQNLPYPLVITEGFGERAMNLAAFSLLSSHAGREVAIDARPARPYHRERPEVIIPLPSNRPQELPDEIIPLARGVRVRILRPPHRGRVGKVRELLPRAKVYPSGVRAASVVVELDRGGTISVPIENLDVLQ